MLGDFQVAGEALRTVRYANDLVLLPEEPVSCKSVRTINRLHDTVHDRARVLLKYGGTRRRTGGEVKGKLENAVGSQYPSHYLGTWCIQHYYR